MGADSLHCSAHRTFSDALCRTLVNHCADYRNWNDHLFLAAGKTRMDEAYVLASGKTFYEYMADSYVLLCMPI